jgi:uncharacterized membrane protein
MVFLLDICFTTTLHRLLNSIIQHNLICYVLGTVLGIGNVHTVHGCLLFVCLFICLQSWGWNPEHFTC